MKDKLGIGLSKLSTLPQEAGGKSIKNSEIADPIWGKEFEEIESFVIAKLKILEIQPNIPRSDSKFLTKVLIKKLGIGFKAMQKPQKKLARVLKL